MGITKLKMSNFAERRKESREKHGDELRAAFKVIDKDNSGWASINEMCAYMVENKKFNLNKRSMGDLYALFAKIDRDGDGQIAIVECVELLDEKADKFGLTKGDIFKRVVHFFSQADKDGDQKISLIEFFIQLPKLEEMLLNKKLSQK